MPLLGSGLIKTRVVAPPGLTPVLALNPEEATLSGANVTSWAGSGTTWTPSVSANTTYSATSMGGRPGIRSTNQYFAGGVTSRSLVRNVGWAMAIIAVDFSATAFISDDFLWFSQGDSAGQARAALTIASNTRLRMEGARLDTESNITATSDPVITGGTGIGKCVLVGIWNYAAGTYSYAINSTTALALGNFTTSGLCADTASLGTAIFANGAGSAPVADGICGRIRLYTAASAPDTALRTAAIQEMLTYYSL